MLAWIGAAACLALMQVANPALAQQRPAEPPARFVQRFYDWYVTILRREGIGSASNHVLVSRGSLFTRDLLRALVEDSLAGAQADDETIVLDFDPFVNSQEFCERYVVGTAVRTGEIVSVDVDEICSGHASRRPAVTAQVRQVGGRWVFVDFDYGRGFKLLGMLRRFRAERSRQRRP